MRKPVERSDTLSNPRTLGCVVIYNFQEEQVNPFRITFGLALMLKPLYQCRYV